MGFTSIFPSKIHPQAALLRKCESPEIQPQQSGTIAGDAIIEEGTPETKNLLKNVRLKLSSPDKVCRSEQLSIRKNTSNNQSINQSIGASLLW
jgi:hypothetical protein